MFVILSIIIFFFMVMIPFLIAIKELKHPKDCSPLVIDMHYSKDPLYFGKAFKKMVMKNIEKANLPDGQNEIILSKKENVEVWDSKTASSNRQYENIFYIKKELTSGNRTTFRKDVYVKGESNIGDNNVLRTIYGEKNINLGKNCHVTRWVCGEKRVMVSQGSQLGKSTTCSSLLQLGQNCRFRALFGGPVLTANDHWEKIQARPDDPLFNLIKKDYPVPSLPEKKPAWRILKKHVSVNCWETGEEDNNKNQQSDPIDDGDEATVKRQCINAEKCSESCNEENWRVDRHRVHVESKTVIKTNFVARKELHIGKNCRIEGAIKSFKDLYLDENVEVHGDIFCEQDIYIGNNCTLLGNVFSQSSINIANRVRIGRPKIVKSVIAKKNIIIGRHSILYGYILAEGDGLVRW
jgi:predicted acyltransferase (DUF342 family)